MNIALSLLGLTASAAGSLWLVGFEMKAHKKRFERTKEMTGLRKQIEAWQRNLRTTIGLLNQANASLDPGREAPYPAYNVEERTRDIREKIDALQREVDALDNINAKVLEDLPPLVHPLAFGLLALGFALQALGLP